MILIKIFEEWCQKIDVIRNDNIEFRTKYDVIRELPVFIIFLNQRSMLFFYI